MARWHRLITATPADVWAVLGDGSLYARWVVGTQDTWERDEAWPALGSELGYTVKLGPWTMKGRTISRLCEPEKRLELEAVNPLGSARIGLRTLRWGDDCLVLVDEHPLRGPATPLHNTALDALVRWRNRHMLARLDRAVKERAEQAGQTEGSAHTAGAGWAGTSAGTSHGHP
ncbi:SRPBCC family protein [Streptomyces sp. NPDC101115]|uniref:SRPBCC family protein n=1 Tax=Streptomyces sp. NPDC101115 TaxID=3366106 RepID=UPI0037F2F6E4